MTRLFYSLQFRLVLGFALVLALALASVSFYVGYAAEQEVGRFENSRETAITARVQQVMARMYSDRRNPAQVQAVLEQAGRLSGRRIILQDPNGEVVGDSHLRIDSRQQRPTTESGPVPILVAGREVWSLFVATDTDPDGIPEPAVASLVSTVNESLIWTGVAAGSIRRSFGIHTLSEAFVADHNLGRSGTALGKRRFLKTGADRRRRRAASVVFNLQLNGRQSGGRRTATA